MKKLMSFILGLSLCVPSLALANGVSLNATRVIYAKDAKQATISSRNSAKETTYLMQTWVEEETGEKSKRFIITPPLLTARPGSENLMRIILKDGSSLPNDRESVFYLNSKAIPSINKAEAEGKNLLIIASVTRIKLFVRPSGLKISPDEAPNKLEFKKEGTNVKVRNPTPYYITITNLQAGSKVISDLMIAPQEEQVINNISASSLAFNTINDYGATTQQIKVNL
jgi:fimbrial chaperone protein